MRWAAMKRMAASNVLIVGVQGLGVEIGGLFIHPSVYLIEVCARNSAYTVVHSEEHLPCRREERHYLRSRARATTRSRLTGVSAHYRPIHSLRGDGA